MFVAEGRTGIIFNQTQTDSDSDVQDMLQPLVKLLHDKTNRDRLTDAWLVCHMFG